jgi:hypothetical protein
MVKRLFSSKEVKLKFTSYCRQSRREADNEKCNQHSQVTADKVEEKQIMLKNRI